MTLRLLLFIIFSGEVLAATNYVTTQSSVPLKQGWGRRLTTHLCPDQATFYNVVSRHGNAKMANGDEAVLALGTWTCGECDSYMYFLNYLYGTIRCEQDNLGCIQDAESNIGVMDVKGMGVGEVMIRGIHFHRGTSPYGGGLMATAATISLELSQFTYCRATTNSGWGGGAILLNSGTLQMYVTSFSNNIADGGNGDDIYVSYASVNVHNSCPIGYGGAPAGGESSVGIVYLLLPTLPQN